ncbi:peptidase C13 [Rhodanobacter sp. L36]|uniref:peptidase C13 n=1 Tax=Rhodanobacter sp. L36 TaxID=1747221 RepID=UPI00131A8117|nr:peptidase C13 [Rhodanobacter sp. L36]
MSIVLAIALQLLPPTARADEAFAARVTRGRLVEVGPTGPAYQKALWSQITGPMTTALKDCLASNAPADRSPFTLVADVTSDGRTTRVAAEPGTPVANCMTAWLASTMLPAPPKLADQPVYPIEIDVSITH